MIVIKSGECEQGSLCVVGNGVLRGHVCRLQCRMGNGV